MTARALMFQGTGSDVGKSLIVAGLCRIAARHGMRVAPFKPQNMSNNAAACPDGGEIGRAQALQAKAAGLTPHVDFNPVLLKPETDRSSQVILHGRPHTRLKSADFLTRRETLLGSVMESFERLASRYDLILVEGAGSASETNLRHRDIANMGFARQAGVPVCLIGDIDRGGVIASLVGTKAVIDPADAAMITGFVINRFRGDPNLFQGGIDTIEEKTGWQSFGIVPWLAAAARLPQEDAVVLERTLNLSNKGKLKIAAPMFSRIANFDDADPLRQEPNVQFSFIPPGQPIPRDTDIVLLLGSKSTIGDMEFMRSQGWDHDIIAHVRAGGRVLGLCGGFQMLGARIIDTEGHDGTPGETSGLGLLQVETHMTGNKKVEPVQGACAQTGLSVSGYEIHTGKTVGADCAHPMLKINGKNEGARGSDGRVEGCYLHGLFTSDAFRASWLDRALDGTSSSLGFETAVDTAINELADGLESAIDISTLLGAAQTIGWQARDDKS